MYCLSLVCNKNDWNLTKIFVRILFIMVPNQRECTRLEQRSVIKFLMAEKCKLCEISKECVKCTEKPVLE